ncbi:HNH endonuclease [Paludibacter jiangxiensis]|uniref:HNH endonuclease n=1 Tax=Paludibacter jiangxiensis TaxID=681398 RepID=A0A161LH89_9BACT|nr:HNH endonuclease signature motif containing protein [Paludibacter jiangxiensis]GAT61456.1 hypothetical protein PJIAN_135 [Paludibacter jiangxiensis]
MAIKVKTRKILWSKSGNRCAICKRQLVQRLTNLKSNFIIGEECHIISSKSDGPRGKYKLLSDYDTYDNLVLLCANDHKLIDEFPETFTVEIVENLKSNHENWIETAIEKDLEEYLKTTNNIELLDEIKITSNIDNVVQGSHFYFYDLTSISDDDVSIEVSELFDNLRDYGDIYSDIEISSRTRCLIDYLSTIKQLNNKGIRFFGKSIVREYSILNIPKSEYKIAMIIAFEVNSNPKSIQNGKLMIQLPQNFTPTI